MHLILHMKSVSTVTDAMFNPFLRGGHPTLLNKIVWHSHLLNWFIYSIEALHGPVTNTQFSKFLLKLLENFRTLKNIARYTTFLILNFAYEILE